MGEDHRSWLARPHGDLQLPKLNSLDDALDLELGLGLPNGASRYIGSNANLIPTTRASPPHMHMQAGENKPHGWFYCFPRYRQAFAPPPNSGIMKQVPASPVENLRQVTAHDAGSNSGQKRFIVFDQSGDKKSLFVSALTAYPPIQPLSSWSPATYEACNLSPDTPGTKAPISHVVPTLIGVVNESHEADSASELHEDTEELNALLYSDDDSNDSEDDDEKSTGHSPSTMNYSEWIEGSAEEEHSSGGVTSLKRRKLGDGGYEVHSVVDGGGSEKPKRYVRYNDDDDAESSCADSLNAGLEKMSSFAGNNRMRNKNICETERPAEHNSPWERWQCCCRPR